MHARAILEARLNVLGDLSGRGRVGHHHELEGALLLEGVGALARANALEGRFSELQVVGGRVRRCTCSVLSDQKPHR